MKYEIMRHSSDLVPKISRATKKQMAMLMRKRRICGMVVTKEPHLHLPGKIILTV